LTLALNTGVKSPISNHVHATAIRWSSVAHKVLLAKEHSLRQHLDSAWNGFPFDIRQPDLFCGQFWRSLKTFLGCSATLVNCALETLLLT